MRWPVLLLVAITATLVLLVGGCAREPLKQGSRAVTLGQGAKAVTRVARLVKGKVAEKGPDLAVEGIKYAPDAYDFIQRYDPDMDGVLNGSDNCPDVFNPGQEESNVLGVGAGDACATPLDFDRDSVEDPHDNCPFVYNPGQEDLVDGDGIGDLCDPDMDGDDVDNMADGDMDGDRWTWRYDVDNDGDGVPNEDDRFDWEPAYI